VLLPARNERAIARVVDALQREVDRSFRSGGTRIAYRGLLARYTGQSHELEIPFGPAIERRFHVAHRERYGFAREDAAVEVVTVDVRSTMTTVMSSGRAPRRNRTSSRPIDVSSAVLRGRRRSIPVWSFEKLPHTVKGPAIVLQSGATLWVAPGWWGAIDRGGALVLRHGAR
jgi:N-methylhydantoinase A/oxoprolinase/acetone carboxylase beta subunit